MGTKQENETAVVAAFVERGIPEAEIVPRVNVLTFGAWRAKGRAVRKGEHGVGVPVYRPGKGKRTVYVFHESQTEPLAPETGSEAPAEAPAPAETGSELEEPDPEIEKAHLEALIYQVVGPEPQKPARAPISAVAEDAIPMIGIAPLAACRAFYARHMREARAAAETGDRRATGKALSTALLVGLPKAFWPTSCPTPSAVHKRFLLAIGHEA